MSRGTNPYRARLSDGTSIERLTRTVEGKAVPRGKWKWIVYDADKQPKRKVVNLGTESKSGAMRKAMDLARRRDLGTFDPWADAAPSGVTLPEATAAYLKSQRRAGRTEKTVGAAQRILEGLEKRLPGGTLVGQIEPLHVERYVAAPKPNKQPKAPATRRRYLAVLGHFFGFCQRQGYLRSDPSAGVEAPTTPTNRRDHVSPSEAEAMLRKLDAAETLAGQPMAWLRDWIEFGLGTGLRPGEQAGLRWSDVRMGEREIRVRGTKTAGSLRIVPVHGQALAVLERRQLTRKSEGGGLVFTGTGGREVSLGYLTKRLKKLAEKAEVPKNVTAYSLRHSYGTRMIAGGVPILDLAHLMGTSVEMIEKHYGHYDPRRGSAHVARIFGADGGRDVAPFEIAGGGS
jgi:integrase/recombinase XerD